MPTPRSSSRISISERSFFYLTFRLCILLVLWALIAVTTNITTTVIHREMMIVSMPNTIWTKKVSIPFAALKINLEGPVDTRMTKRKRPQNASAVGVRVEWRNSEMNKIFMRTHMWNVYLLQNKTLFEEVSTEFSVSPEDMMHDDLEPIGISHIDWALAVSVISVQSKSDQAVGLRMTLDKSPQTAGIEVVYALCLVVVLYAMIITEYIDRYFGAILICSGALTLMAFIGHKHSFGVVAFYVNFGTLMILLGSMIMVVLLSETGFFDYVTLQAYRISKGHSWLLIFLMCMFAAFMSAILDNSTVILLLAPASIRLCEAAFINTKYVLIILAIYSNLGGSTTPVGVPPNVIISTDPAMEKLGINFSYFMGHMLPAALICMAVVFGLIFCCVGGRIYKLNQNQLDRRRAMKKPTPEIHERMKKLKRKMRTEEHPWIRPVHNYFGTLALLEANQPIMNLRLLAQIGVALVFTIGCFCVRSVPSVIPNTSLEWISMLAAFLLLILANQHSISPVLARIEWGMLLYLTSLFILTEVIVDLGFIFWLGDLTTEAIVDTDISQQTLSGMMLILWSSALVSSFIDNSAVATILLKLCIKVGYDEATAVTLMPLVWALLLGLNYGGNGTLLGSISNEFVVMSAEQHGYDITFMDFFTVGFPIMIVTLVICSLYLIAAETILALRLGWV